MPAEEGAVVHLTADIVSTLDAIGANLALAVEEIAAISVDFTHPQIIAAIATKTLKQQDELADAAEGA